MISFLTAIVLMVAFGTVIQKSDGVSHWLGTSAKPEVAPLLLVDDRVIVPAQGLTRVDVLANDTGLGPIQRAGLTVVRAPDCGQVFVQDGMLQYLASEACGGERRVTYTVPEAVGGATATVFLSVMGGRPDEPEAVASAVTPVRSVASLTDSAAPRAVQRSAALPSPPTSLPDSPPVQTLLEQSPPSPERALPGKPYGVEERVAVYGQPAGQPLTAPRMPIDAVDAPSDLGRGSAPQLPTTPQIVTRLDGVEPSVADFGSAASNIDASPPPEEDPVKLAAAPTGLAAPLGGGLPVASAEPDGLTATPSASLPSRAADWVVSFLSADATPPDSATDMLIAVREVREPSTAVPAQPMANPQAGSEDRELLAVVNMSQPGRIGEAKGLHRAPLDPGRPLDGLPIDRSQSEPAFAPPASPTPQPRRGLDASQQLSSLEPEITAAQRPATTSDATVAAAAPAAPAPRRVDCKAPPSTAIDVGRGARTTLSVAAPCQAGTIAELTYSGIRFALALDDAGRGEIVTFGFEANVNALLTFADGTRIDFDLPFKGVQKVSRVALVWDLPVSLELNALEFGALTGSEQHVRPDNPRSFDAVRRSGGGFLNSFRARGGVGQNVEVYSFWQRLGGETGIVKMMIDFASRNRERLDGTCGEGPLSAPQFLVMRSDGGTLQRPILRRLAPLNCSDIALETGDKRLISEGIEDLLIR